MKRFYVIIITVIITLSVVFGLGLAIQKKNKKPKMALKVRFEQVRKGELVEFVSAPGQIEPITKVAISAKMSARIVELPYDEGDTVTKGDPKASPPVEPSVLVRLDAKNMESQLQSVKASRSAQVAQIKVEKTRIAAQKATLMGLEASLKQAKRDRQRKKGLFESKDISQSVFDQAQFGFDEKQAQYNSAVRSMEAAVLNLIVLRYNLEVADAKISQAEEALSYTTIASPIDGVVTRINAEVGELVMTGTMNNPGTMILEVADLSQMLLVAEIDEADIGNVKVGQNATVRVQAFVDEDFTGMVDSIALTHRLSRNGTKFFRTEVILEPCERQLYSGLTAAVDIETHKYTDIIKVPSQAVLARKVDDLPLDIRKNSPEVNQNKIFVTVVYRVVDDKTVVTPVKIGSGDMTHTIIESGLSEDDKIVIGPYKMLDTLKHDAKVEDERKSAEKADADDANNVDSNSKNTRGSK